MSRFRPLVVGTLIVTAGLISVNAVGYAATGSNVILGHTNHANRTTKIVRTTAGPALALHVKAHQVPFTVNSTKQVARLNASYVDGMRASSLQTHAIAFGLPTSATASGSITYPLAALPTGSYDASFDVVAHMTASGDQLDCVIEQQTSFTLELLGYGSTYGSFSAVSASGLVTVAAGRPLELRCFTSAGMYEIGSGDPAMVEFTKIDNLATHSAAAAMARPRSAAHPAASGR